ncbi:MAG: DUF3458 domain-containing protein [Thermodesulfobacteriota bacterium]
MEKVEEVAGATKQFRYVREGFADLPVKVVHLTIYLNFIEGKVEATNCLEMTALVDMDEISLDADDLDIGGVEWCAGPDDSNGVPLDFEYIRDEKRLTVKLPRTVEAGEGFFLRTTTTCVPSDHILEGLYLDATPPGAPQQYISQCQQWGFQRIMPVLDDCRAKCTMTTTIEAESAYTHLISNGNISPTLNPLGKPIKKDGDPTRQLITYENPTPMASYIFLVAVGTWDTLEDEVTYPSGRTVRLEYLVPPGMTDEARIPMEILKQSVLWIGERQGYEYTFDTYRTICMTKSNFGGMENLGNTTIVTDAALITEHTLDTMLLYAHAVIVHEFEHNQCGSETTMESPFDVWLNEAYTVDVERQFMADHFDPAFIRLHQVDSIRSPLLGPLAIEDGGHYGRIVRDGFNEPDELIDGVTYVKAAEVIRMLRLVIGPEAFQRGKSLYFDRYRGGNADTDQFFACFEEVSGISLTQFKQEWLYRIGYPKVSATTEYNGATKEYRIRLSQEVKEGGSPFCLPLKVALVDGDGRDMEGTERLFTLSEGEGEIVFGNISEPPAVASMNRDYSFYGTFKHTNVDTGALVRQIRLDPNIYNRVDAMRHLTDTVRITLLNDPDAPVCEEWLSLYGEIVADSTLPEAIKAYLLRIDEQPVDRQYSTWYRELVVARERLMLAVNGRYRDELVREFNVVEDNLSSHGDRAGMSIGEGIERRMLKNILLHLIAIDDTPESHRLTLDAWQTAATATERVAALTALNRSSAPSRHTLLAEVYRDWHSHLSGYANYLRVVASGTGEDIFERIEAEESRPSFDITHPTWSRALYLGMATNTKMVWSDEGIEWVADSVIRLAPINGTTAGRLLNTFQHLRLLKPPLGEQVRTALERIVEGVTEDVSQSIHGQGMAYLGK